jgi:hypothetical protein
MKTRCVCRWAGYDAQHVVRVRGIKRLSDRKKDSGKKGGGKNGGGKDGDGKTGAGKGGAKWGRVLRTAYDDALREPVPDEFLDLLGKLD